MAPWTGTRSATRSGRPFPIRPLHTSTIPSHRRPPTVHRSRWALLSGPCWVGWAAGHEAMVPWARRPYMAAHAPPDRIALDDRGPSRRDPITNLQAGVPSMTADSRRDPLRISGTILADKYQIGDVVGEGGFSVVYSAVHTIWQQPVAIKCFQALANSISSRRTSQPSRRRRGRPKGHSRRWLQRRREALAQSRLPLPPAGHGERSGHWLSVRDELLTRKGDSGGPCELLYRIDEEVRLKGLDDPAFGA